jgi:hypothetical protein
VKLSGLAITAAVLVAGSLSGATEQPAEPIPTAIPAPHFGIARSGAFSKRGVPNRRATASRRSRAGRPADRLLAELRRAATPQGALPERVDAGDGRPTSTTPLAWSHAFAILALRARYAGR